MDQPPPAVASACRIGTLLDTILQMLARSTSRTRRSASGDLGTPACAALRNCSTAAASASAGPRRCRSWPAGSTTSPASGMRRASKVLFDGGTTRSWLPQTTRVGAVIAPRKGMLDQRWRLPECHTAPGGRPGPGRRSDGARRRRSEPVSPGVAPTPHEVDTRTNRRSRPVTARRTAGRPRRPGRSRARRHGPGRRHRAPRRRAARARQSERAGAGWGSRRRRAGRT